MVTDIPDADYAIFDSISGQKKDIVVLLNHCLQLAKPTVLSADFIRDSVDQYKFLDPNVYLLDKTSKRRRSVQVKAEPESSSVCVYVQRFSEIAELICLFAGGFRC